MKKNESKYLFGKQSLPPPYKYLASFRFFRYFFFVALAFFFASCSESSIEEKDVNIKIPVSSMFSRAVTDDDGSVYSVSVTLENGDSLSTQTATGTISEIGVMTFVFPKIKIGSKVALSCEIKKDEKLIWYGKSETVIASPATRKIEIQMVANAEQEDPQTTSQPIQITIQPLDIENEITLTYDQTTKHLIAKEGFSSYEWWIDGMKQQETTNILDFSEFPSGIYQITIIADNLSAMFELKETQTTSKPIQITLPPLSLENEITLTLDKANSRLIATEGFSTYEWWIDGVKKQTATINTLDISTLPSGIYQIAIIADLSSARFELEWEAQ